MAVMAAAAIPHLVRALMPAIKTMMAAEMVNVAKKHMFDGDSKVGKQLNKQMMDTLQQELNNMSPDEWGKVLQGVDNKGKYKKKAGHWLGELLPSAVGMGASTAGAAWNLNNSIMANAISSAMDNMVNPMEAQVWGNPYKASTALYTGGKMAQGAIANAIGSGIGGWFNNLSNKITAENQQQRMLDMMLNDTPSGEAWRTYRWANGAGGMK